jgi:tRNA dimethylallyltransferase
MKQTLVAVLGPTAAGKTELGAALAVRLGGEVVSVDSRQVYRRLDVGTAKPDAATRALVPHHLLDLVEPDEPFDAAAYAREARRTIAAIAERGRPAVLCGGSGLYYRALTEGLFDGPAPDPDLRRELDAELARRGAAALHGELLRLDPRAAARIAPRDAARIRRGLEVVRLTGRPISEWQERHGFRDRPYEVLVFVLSPPVADLDRRIAERAAAMWRGGLVDETRAVLEAGFPGTCKPLAAIGYREAQAHLRGALGSEEAIAAIVLATRRYAKRQRTWFRRLDGARRLAGGEPLEEVLVPAQRFLAGGSAGRGLQ